ERLRPRLVPVALPRAPAGHRRARRPHGLRRIPVTRAAWPPDALVLTAGIGSRLHPLTLVRAKPAVPLAGIPLVGRILRGLAAAGLRRVVLNLHHRPESIARVVGDGSDLGLTLRYSWEQPIL